MLKHPFKNKKVLLKGFQNIQKKLTQQRLLLRVVRSSLDDNIASHCLHISANSKHIILFTDSSIWASKLLYMRPCILKALSSHFDEQVHTLKIKVLTKKISSIPILPKVPSDKAIKSLSTIDNNEATDKLNVSINKLIKTLKKNKLLN